jgi:hypothetical protein
MSLVRIRVSYFFKLGPPNFNILLISLHSLPVIFEIADRRESVGAQGGRVGRGWWCWWLCVVAVAVVVVLCFAVVCFCGFCGMCSGLLVGK